MPDHLAADYRGMAERALAQASGTKDPAIKASLLEIASRYAWMADWAERQPGMDRAAEPSRKPRS